MIARRLLAIAALAVTAVAWIGCGAGDAWFYRPDSHVYATPESLGTPVERVAFSAPGGPRLDGWWLPAEQAAGTVVYCHGNSQNLTRHARYVAWLPRAGFNVLLFDYRGYGRSDGLPDRAGTVDDTIAAVDLALARDPDRTLVYGHSLGGALGLVAAARRPAVRAVVAESTFATYRAAAAATAPLLSWLTGWLVSAGHEPRDALAAIPPRPLLVVHGTADRIVPFELGRRLYEAAAEPKRLHAVAGGGHRSPWVRDGAAFEDVLVGFFRHALDPHGR